jgi:glucose/arabinose dehydrogenase
MRTLFDFPLAVAVVCLAPVALAQIGDRADKAGEVQKSIVPADQIPPAPALTPEEALKSFRLAPGIKLELAAAEPLVQEPVAIAFGADGRMWVVEMRGYMPDLDGNGEDAPVGRVVALTDQNGDGRYDDSKVFIDQLVLPRATFCAP